MARRLLSRSFKGTFITLGALDGLTVTQTKMHPIKKIPRRTPGNTPAIRSFPMEVSVEMP